MVGARKSLIVMALGLVMGLPPAPVSAQAPQPIACAYEACGLRLRSGLFGRDLVRGIDEERVSGLGPFVGSLDHVFVGSPLAQDLAASYRRRHNVGGALTLVGTTLMVVGILAFDHGGAWDQISDTGFGVILGGSVVALGGTLVARSGEDRLSRAVFEYNRALSGR